MTRQEAFDLFDGAEALADALELSRGRVYQWPKTGPLPDSIADRVRGAAVRQGIELKRKHRK